MTEPMLDILGRPRSPATMPGYFAGRSPGSRGKTYRPTIFSPEDVELVLGNCPSGVTGLRLQALIGILYRTGMAISEAIGLDIGDLDLRPGQETVHVHGGRLAPRRLALDSSAIGLLEPWLDARSEMSGTALFCVIRAATKGARWTENAARTAFEDVADRLGWKRLVPGDFRFSFVIELMIEQWPIPYIQAQLGTRSLRSFEKIYQHLEIRVPEDYEIVDIVRVRPWPRHGEAP